MNPQESNEWPWTLCVCVYNSPYVSERLWVLKEKSLIILLCSPMLQPAGCLLRGPSPSSQNHGLGWLVPTPVRLLPCPRHPKALVEVGVLRRPVQLPVDLGGVAVHLGIVTWSAGEVVNLDIDSGRLLAGLNELLYWPTWPIKPDECVSSANALDCDMDNTPMWYSVSLFFSSERGCWWSEDI